jgi:hypothetical protein
VTPTLRQLLLTANLVKLHDFHFFRVLEVRFAGIIESQVPVFSYSE